MAYTRSCASVALIVLLFFLLFSANAKNHGCDLDTSPFLPAPFNVSSSSLRCRHVWSNFIFRYSLSKDNVLRVIVSTLYTGGWVGMGFSRNGEMVISSAMVGWIGYDGKAYIKQYYLRGFSPAQVIADHGRLQIIGLPVVALKRENIYLAFDLNFSTIPNRRPLSSQPLVFAFSRFKPSYVYMLPKHDKKSTVIFDFSAGASFISRFPYQLRRNHEALSVFGWGFLTPLGVLFARYCRRWDPVWYYLHVVIHFLGFFVGLAGFLAGISLYHKAHSNLTGHRGLGIFVFVLCILQILPFFVRLQEGTPMYRYWSWYHRCFGWLTVTLAAVNIVYGLRLGQANSVMAAGFAFIACILIVLFTTLEIIFKIKQRRLIPDSPAFRVYRIQQ